MGKRGKTVVAGSLVLGLGLAGALGWGQTAIAIPGQSREVAEAWVQAHPTLRPTGGERLSVRRAETPARRFQFRATVLPVTGITPGQRVGRTIRTEEITLVDLVDGITATRMEESLRVIYDAMIYNDFRRAEVVLRYDTATLSPQRWQSEARLQGELRRGDRFAYLLELSGTQNAPPTSGQIKVFLIEDLSPLQATLAQRFAP